MHFSKSSALSLLSTFALISSLFYYSCSKEHVVKEAILSLPNAPLNYSLVETPGNGVVEVKNLILDESKDVFSDHSATLGRVLFYDTKLSINNTVSCGSCHIQELGFSDGTQFSAGFADRKTPRNSMAIINPVSSTSMFWDVRAESAYNLSLQPVFNHLEMGIEDDEMLVRKIQEADYYNDLFVNAFQSPEVTKEKISLALASFMNAMFSRNSKWDQGQQLGFSNFNGEEKLGMELFNSSEYGCNGCHNGQDFSNFAYYNRFNSANGTANIGLDKNSADKGAGNGAFKIPALRNVALTAPYMHDGRFNTLEEVLRHYAHGVQDNPSIAPSLRSANGSVKRVNMTSVEEKALVAFLHTLTDESFISDPKFSNPFK